MVELHRQSRVVFCLGQDKDFGNLSCVFNLPSNFTIHPNFSPVLCFSFILQTLYLHRFTPMPRTMKLQSAVMTAKFVTHVRPLQATAKYFNLTSLCYHYFFIVKLLY